MTNFWRGKEGAVTLTDLDDPFATPAESRVSTRSEIITGGRYRLPNLDGSPRKGGWQRVTNLVGAFSDQYGLRMWEIEQGLRGVAWDHTLYTEMVDSFAQEMDKDTRRAWVSDFLERAKDSAKANAGRDFGNHRHAVVELHHAGLPLGVQNSLSRRHVKLYADALVRHRLQAMPGMQERRVLVESLEACGTLDNILTDMVTGLLHIGDLKTQKRFWTWLEIAAQEACYANADAIWDAEAGCWVEMPKVSRDVGMVLWMPREHPSGEPQVDIYEVDIKAGWETAKLAYRVVKDRAAGKRARNPRGWLRPAPPMTDLERYAALFAGVDSMAEGRSLVAEARRKGVWCTELADCARLALQRIQGLTSTKN